MGRNAMRYDFTTRVNRAGTGSSKWDGMLKDCPDVPADVVPLSVADMEFVKQPEIATCLHRIADEAILGYTGPTDAYYEAVIGWQERRHKWAPERDWIATCPGVVPALYRFVEALTEPGDGVIIQPPVYFPFKSAVQSAGRTLVENPLRLVGDGTPQAHYEMDFDDLERKAADPATKMILRCSPHNPAGRVWTAGELRRCAEICLAHGVFIVCDEIHNDLIMPGHTHTTLARVIPDDELGHIAVCTAPSKTFNLAGLECSNIFIPDEEVRTKFKRLGFRRGGPFSLNAFAYPVCACAYNECENWLDELLEVLDGNRRFVEDYVARELPQIKVMPLEGTYLQWLDMRAFDMDADTLKTFLHTRAHLFGDEGAAFGTGGAGFERINIACPTDVLREALDRLTVAVHTL